MSILCTSASGGAFHSGAGLTAVTAAWQWFVWVKMAAGAYSGSSFAQALSWPGGSDFYGVDTGEPTGTPNTNLAAYTGGGGSQDILTGSDQAWVFIAGHYTGSGNNYPFRWRKEGVGSFTSFTINNGAQITGSSIFHLWGNAFSDPVNTYLRSFCFQSGNLSDADLLTASQSLTTPAVGTNLTFLALNDATSTSTVGANLANGSANWSATLTGMSTQSGVEPNPALASAGGTTFLTASDRINRNTLLRL